MQKHVMFKELPRRTTSFEQPMTRRTLCRYVTTQPTRREGLAMPSEVNDALFISEGGHVSPVAAVASSQLFLAKEGLCSGRDHVAIAANGWGR